VSVRPPATATALGCSVVFIPKPVRPPGPTSLFVFGQGLFPSFELHLLSIP
jgi:hypothetical protein